MKRFAQPSRKPCVGNKNGSKRVLLFLSEFTRNGWQNKVNESHQPLNLSHYEQTHIVIISMI